MTNFWRKVCSLQPSLWQALFCSGDIMSCWIAHEEMGLPIVTIRSLYMQDIRAIGRKLDGSVG